MLTALRKRGMQAIVYSSLASAQAIQARIDATLGYPRDCRRAGGGLHVPAWQAQSTTWARIVANQDGIRWAYPTDGLYEFLTPTERTEVVWLESDWGVFT